LPPSASTKRRSVDRYMSVRRSSLTIDPSGI
jgi:hypothetical protein